MLGRITKITKILQTMTDRYTNEQIANESMGGDLCALWAIIEQLRSDLKAAQEIHEKILAILGGDEKP